MGVPPLGLDGGTPCQDWMGVTPLSGDRATERALATRRAVCLLRSSRRTFLFNFNFSYINDDWQPYTSQGASYAEFRGPGDFRYFYGQAVREERCSMWLYSYE